MAVLRVLGTWGLVGLAVPSAAQVSANLDDFPVVRLGFEGYPDSSPKTPPSLSPDLEARIVHSSIEAQLPWRKSDASVFIGGTGFDLVRFDMRQNTLPWAPKDLYDVGLAVSWDQRLSTGWWLSAAARPHLATDFNAWGFDHMNVDASILFSGGHRGRGRYGVGAIMTSVFGERLILPLVELSWSRSDAVWDLDLLFPTRAGIVYRPTRSIGLGVRGRVQGNRYRIGESIEFPTGTAVMEPLVRYSLITVGPVFETKLSPDTYLTLETGAALLRRFDIDANDKNIADLDLGNDVEFSLALEVRI